jgi:site-specific recombinase XerD
MTTELVPAGRVLEQATRLAVMGFLARYRGATLRAYGQDVQAFLRWCAMRELEPLEAGRPQLELYVRWMEQQGYAPTTISRASRRSPVCTAMRLWTATSAPTPTVAVTRPKAPWEAQHRTVLHPLEYAALLTAARRDGPPSHALVALLGMIGPARRRDVPTGRHRPAPAGGL